MSEIVVKLVAAYLLGTVMGGHLIGLLRGGVDLRKVGSGNVGATNALRTQGKAFALGVLLVDVAKGVLAVTWLPAIEWPAPSLLPRESMAYLCGVAVALGHCYPVFYRFHGGKGVATLAGVYGAVLPWALPFMIGAFVLAIMLTGYVALGSVGAALTALTWVAIVMPGGLVSPAGAFTVAMATLVVWKHRDNLRRIARGEEHCFERARVLRWRRR